MKRLRSAEDESQSCARKRPCTSARFSDRLHDLSDEISLRILSHLHITDLAVCQRTCKYLHVLANDNQIWSSLYYQRYVLARSSKSHANTHEIPTKEVINDRSKYSRWKRMESLQRSKVPLDWKRQYKIKHNWERGTCSANEVRISEGISTPPLLVQMREGTIFLADTVDGLRAWNRERGEGLVAKFDGTEMITNTNCDIPAGLAVDHAGSTTGETLVAVGYQNGSTSIFCLHHDDWLFRQVLRHHPEKPGILTSIAFAFPYFATMTDGQSLAIYKLSPIEDTILSDSQKTGRQPTMQSTLIHSLQSHTVYPPHTLKIRSTPTSITVSVAYALPSYLWGWTVGIQELQICPSTSTVLNSRLASASTSSTSTSCRPTYLSAAISRIISSRSSNTPTTRPTSLSYTHPYILSTHPDNTLVLWLVTSTQDSLVIEPAKTLWGHTSSVSGTSIGQRGKAVSVTKRGDDIRVWDLEATIGRGRGLQCALKPGCRGGEGERDAVVVDDDSVRIMASKAESRVGNEDDDGEKEEAVVVDGSVGVSKRSIWGERRGMYDLDEELTTARGWIGFDEENVVLLKEQAGRGQSLMVYNFA